MARRRYRGRRRGYYISPIVVLAGLAVIVLGVFLLVRALGGDDAEKETGGENAAESAEGNAGTAQTDGAQTGVPEEDSELPEKFVSTVSGIDCVLTELEEEDIHTGGLILVNNWNFFHFPAEQELVSVYEEKSDGYYVRDLTVYLAPEAMEAMDQMLMDFRSQGGSKSVNVVAGHRTEEYQQGLFDRSAERNGLAHAEKYVAKPGGSEHHTGLAVDFSILRGDGSSADYDGSGEYAWINKNCHKYGFVVRYETGKEELTGIWNEPWHFRYLGVPHASELVRKGMCMEEYMDYLKKFTFDGKHLFIDCVAGEYEVWYTEGTQVYLPEGGEYEVSGNNTDGFIVTCKVA